MSGKRILLVEDNPDITKLNRMALELAGYQVLEADTLAKGRELLEKENPDLIVLDILLPDGNSLAYCRELHDASDVRILFLSALNTKEDSLAGLRAGGDDYIAKPYLLEELLLRVETLLRRGPLTAKAETSLRFGAFEIELSTRRAFLGDEDLLLKPKEFSVLEILARNRDRAFTAEELYEKLWGMDTVADVRTVHNTIYGLRKKLGRNSRVIIEQKRGLGYQLSIAINEHSNITRANLIKK